MKPNPSKVQAIAQIPTPHDKSAVHHLLGMINFLGPHIPNLAAVSTLLRELVKADVHFEWNFEAEKAWKDIKTIMATEKLLFFDPALKSTVQADASQHGLGACLTQTGKPVVYASQNLSQAEHNYAVIVKELLAIIFACNKFHRYIYGFPTDIQTDHQSHREKRISGR